MCSAKFYAACARIKCAVNIDRASGRVKITVRRRYLESLSKCPGYGDRVIKITRAGRAIPRIHVRMSDNQVYLTKREIMGGGATESV